MWANELTPAKQRRTLHRGGCIGDSCDVPRGVLKDSRFIVVAPDEGGQ